MSGYCEDCGNTACICPTGGLAATPHCADSEHHWIHRAQPDYPEWLAFIAYCSICGRFGPLDLRDGWQVVAVDAAAPHLTADLVRERDEALAEVERLRAKVEAVSRECRAEVWTSSPHVAVVVLDAYELLYLQAIRERDEALAEVERLTALVNAKQSWIDGAKVDLEAADVPMSPNKGHDETGALADLQERIARAIDHRWDVEADSNEPSGYTEGLLDGLDAAATVARETPLRGEP